MGDNKNCVAFLLAALKFNDYINSGSGDKNRFSLLLMNEFTFESFKIPFSFRIYTYDYNTIQSIK